MDSNQTETPSDLSVILNVHNLSKAQIQSALKNRGLSPTNKSRSELKAYALLFNKRCIRRMNLSPENEDNSRTITKASMDPDFKRPGNIINKRKQITANQLSQEEIYDLSTWKIKYNGVSNVLDFIERIEETASIKNIPLDALQRNFIELISPELIPWHRIQKRKCKDWNKLKTALISSFGKTEAQHRIKLSLLSIKQLVNESVATFIERAESINVKLANPIPEDELLPVITDGLLQKYESIITSQKITSLLQLNEVCFLLESYQDRKNSRVVPNNRAVPNHSTELKPEFDNKKICSFCKKVGHLAATCFRQAKVLESKEPRTFKRKHSKDRSPRRDDLRDTFKRSKFNMERLQEPGHIKPQVDFSKPPPNFHRRNQKN